MGEERLSGLALLHTHYDTVIEVTKVILLSSIVVIYCIRGLFDYFNFFVAEVAN